MSAPSSSDLVVSVQAAHDALLHANRQREVAVEAVVDFALRAVLAGEDLTPIMEACGFVEQAGEEPTGLAALLGLAPGSPRHRFAQWLATALVQRILNTGETPDA